MARFSCHEYRLCIMTNAFKLSFSVYGFQVNEANSNLVRHFSVFKFHFPVMIWRVGENHMSLIRWFWPLVGCPLGWSFEMSSVSLLVGQHKWC